MMKIKVEEKGDGIFIPRELLDELEIDRNRWRGSSEE
jgi:hypothetical protein